MANIAAPIVVRSMASDLTNPLPIVTATAVPDITPTPLSTVAINTADRGERTRVETTVAIALGASVAPLTNSAATTSSRTTINPSVTASIQGTPERRRR